ncbi:MAG: hypothetical protein L6R42_008106 [Xanthoria sp. 1 TBL-2021]|nr:MAG: hypothetical protein L6R42_008106 [Xanthoria sp. 1 TBL-2021]
MTLEGQEGHDQDISNFLRSELKAGTGAVFEAIEDEILKRASGVFLWVALVVQILNKEYDHGRVHALRRRLKEIPDGLDKLFEDILTRDNAHFEELILCLQWILYAERPMKREELYYAILSSTDEEALTPWDPEMVTAQDIDKFILSCSKGLAETTNPKSQTVQFIHESVRDFLLGKNGINKLRSELDFGQSHERLKQCCYSYMKIDVSADLPRDMELPKASTPEAKDLRTRISMKFPFLEYAVHHVLFHADHAARHGISQELFLQYFATEQWIFLDNMFERYQVRRRTDIDTSNLLFISTQKDLGGLVRTYRRTLQSDGLDCNPDILTAALFDFKVSEDTIRALLLLPRQSEAFENAIEKVIELWPSFFASKITKFLPWAASSGHVTVIRSLLHINAITPHICNRKDAQGRTMLSLAALNGHHAVVELLLANKASPGILDREGRAPLMLAAMNGHEAVVELLLLSVSYDFSNETDKHGQTPLALAATNGHDAVVKFLLANKPGLSKCDNDERTPLILAAINGHKDVVKLLLENSANPDNQDIDEKTALMYAAENGHEATVQVLLENSDDPYNRDRDLNTPFLIAAAGGHEAVIRLLLGNPASVGGHDAWGRTPLIHAAFGGYEAVVRLLLENSANVNDRDKGGTTALMDAARGGHEAVVRLLLESSASANGHDLCGKTSLMYAAQDGYEAVVRLLLENSANVNHRDEFGTTSLRLAAMSGHEAVVKLLLENSANVNDRDKDGTTALMWAESRGHQAMVKLLRAKERNEPLDLDVHEESSSNQ